MRGDISTILKRISKGHRPKENNVYGQWRWQRSFKIKGVKDRKAKGEGRVGEEEKEQREKEEEEDIEKEQQADEGREGIGKGAG